MFKVIGEKFDCSLVEREHDAFVIALKDALELSNVHDMDFVLIFNDRLPVGKCEDGKLL